jgi:tRNA dimethylallyltransferase
MIEKLFQSIRHLAKRQMTWFRGMERRGIPIRWVERGDMEEVKNIVQYFLAHEK